MPDGEAESPEDQQCQHDFGGTGAGLVAVKHPVPRGVAGHDKGGECPQPSRPNGRSGHGTCAHFLTEDAAGGFQYGNVTVLGQLADGECTCDVGYAGPNCIRAHGFDLDNPESICNGHGDILEVYDQIGNNIFEI